MLTQIDERNLAMEKDYASICAVAPEFAHIASLDEFKWARMCVCSRNFGLIVNGLRTAGNFVVVYKTAVMHVC
jgi:histone-lysine N-methyltransferase SETD3